MEWDRPLQARPIGQVWPHKGKSSEAQDIPKTKSKDKASLENNNMTNKKHTKEILREANSQKQKNGWRLGIKKTWNN